jgi:hypothetical protein
MPCIHRVSHRAGCLYGVVQLDAAEDKACHDAYFRYHRPPYRYAIPPLDCYCKSGVNNQYSRERWYPYLSPWAPVN